MVIALSLVLSPWISSENVFALSIPSANQVASDIERRYHIDPAVVRNYGEGFNVTENKGDAPQVTIFFSPSDPKDGEKITAKAFPAYFSNPNESQLYYTWYLKRNGCEIGGGGGVPDYCEQDGRGGITVNDWKVAASRILVTDGADSNGFVYDGDTDSDGYRAQFGGELEVDTTDDWCYMQDASSGAFYELENGCIHLFPDTPNGGDQVGGPDGTFGIDDERAWGTNPHDPDTSGNGNKDEANAVGLGRDTIKWNYQTGDQIGVVVEGKSMVSTKHDDSSMMDMWAFSKNKKCPIRSIGSYTENIHGYDVTFPTTNLDQGDFDDCLVANLVDPMDSESGSSKKIDVSVVASPENPVNDNDEGIGGDMVTASASLDNSSKSASEILYSWTVELSGNPISGWVDVTSELENAGLLTAARLITLPNSTTQAISQNGLSSIGISLNMGDEILGAFSNQDPVYMRITTRVSENYSANTYTAVTESGSTVANNAVARPQGQSDVVVKISNTDKKIDVYTTTATSAGATSHVALDDRICNLYYPNPTSQAQAQENLNRVACRVLKNEIIGVNVDDMADYRNISWTINGASLNCSATLSPNNCGAGGTNAAGDTAFFAVTGEPGETYTIRMDAVSTDTGRAVSLSRVFQIVNPQILIDTLDENALWAKYVGTFTELNGTRNDEYSDEIFQMYPGGSIVMQATTLPGYAAKYLSSHAWTVDGVAVADSGIMQISYVPPRETVVGDANFVHFSGKIVQPAEKRLALLNLWNIDALGSSEVETTKDARVETVENADAVVVAGSPTNRFLAAISNYVPPFVVFGIRMILTSALLLFTVGFVFSLIPESSIVQRENVRSKRL